MKYKNKRIYKYKSWKSSFLGKKAFFFEKKRIF